MQINLENAENFECKRKAGMLVGTAPEIDQRSRPAAEPGPVPRPVTDGPISIAGHLYLDLLKKCLTRLLFPDGTVTMALEHTAMFDRDARENGRDWPSEADTMIGWKRLSSLEDCVATIIAENIPGDLVETGVWRGGASILMRAILAAVGDRERKVWVADSFEGLPEPDRERYPADSNDRHCTLNSYLGISLETVQANFTKFGLLDSQVCFLKGWFKDSLPGAPIKQIAVLRLDGDMYGSTMDVLDNLYERVVPGGYVVVDDYGALENCRKAVYDFRKCHGITEEIVPIDWTGAFWRRK